VKIYLDASPEVRARRRAQERGIEGDFATETELRDVKLRDRIDQSREAAPLRVAEDADVLDTDHLDLTAVLRRAIDLTTDALRRHGAEL
jgi:cytidylate kinase